MRNARPFIAGFAGVLLAAGMVAVAVPLAWRDGTRGPVRGPARTLDAIDAEVTVTEEEEYQARALLKTNPGFGGAYRVLAQAALQRNEVARADALLAAAVKLDPREVTTRALLIDRAYARQDAAALAEHADALLRIAPAAGQALLPQLTFLLQSPEVRAAFVARMAADTPWRNTLAAAMASGPSPDAALDYLERVGERTPLTEPEQNVRLQLLLAAGRGTEARTSWVQALATNQRAFARPYLVDGGFEAGETPPPFGWRLGQSPSVMITPDPFHLEGASSLALVFDGREVQGFSVQQALVLSPGRYTFGGQANNQTTASRRFRWLLRCQDQSGTPVGEVDLPAATGTAWQSFEAVVTVPAQCAAQSLTLIYPARSKSERIVKGTLYIDGLYLQPLH